MTDQDVWLLSAMKRVVSVSVIRPIGIESRMDGRISASDKVELDDYRVFGCYG